MPSAEAPTPATDRNRSLLREAYLEHLLALKPASFLDVGCGGGELLPGLGGRGIALLGIEPGPKANRARRALLDCRAPVVRADAHRLPLVDECFEWVGIRHALHHFEDPRRALAEAWRVARRGLLLAEPYFDLGQPAQRFGHRVDGWVRRHELRPAEVHHPELDEDAMLALLPQPASATSVQTTHLGTSWPRDEIAVTAHEVLEGRTPSEDDARELDVLLEVAQRGGIQLNGSLELLVWKSAAAPQSK